VVGQCQQEKRILLCRLAVGSPPIASLLPNAVWEIVRELGCAPSAHTTRGRPGADLAVLARRLELSGLPRHLHAGEHLYMASSLRHRGELHAAGAVRRGELRPLLRQIIARGALAPDAGLGAPSDIVALQTALRLKLGSRSATPMINGVATSTDGRGRNMAPSSLGGNAVRSPKAG
jgi:hypothetical protein